jgi:hypothetical protein
MKVIPIQHPYKGINTNKKPLFKGQPKPASNLDYIIKKVEGGNDSIK